MARGIFSKLGWIGIGALISSPISGYFEPLFSDLYYVTKDSAMSLAIEMYPNVANALSTLPLYLPYVVAGIGAILIGWDLAIRRRSRNRKRGKEREPVRIYSRIPDTKLSELTPKSANLQCGRLCVKKRTERMHGGIYVRSFHYIEIVNSVPGTVALDCQGSINLDSNTFYTIWEKNRSNSITIGHSELLYLFEISVFTDGVRNETRLYLDWDPHTVDTKAIDDYNSNLDKELMVLIQSENAQFPSRSESFKKTTRQIIHESIEC